MNNIFKRFIPLSKTIFLTVLFILISQVIYIYCTKHFNMSNLGDVRNPKILVFATIYCLFVVVYALAACRFVDKRKINDIGFKMKKKDTFLIIASLLVMVFGFLLVIFFTKQLGIARWNWSGVKFVYVISSAFFYLTVGINEEIFFRGYLYKSLTRYGKISAYIISILIFSLIHFTTQDFSLSYLFELLFASFLYAYIFDVSGSIWPVIIIHAGYDFIAGLFGGNMRKASLIIWQYLDKRFQLVDIFMYSSILFEILILLFTFYMYNYKKKEKELAVPAGE